MSDINLLKTVGSFYEIEHGRDIPFIVVTPQCEYDTWFEIMESLLNFISGIIDDKNVDKTKVYLSGISMAGYT